MLRLQKLFGEALVKQEKLRILVLGDSRSFHIERYLAELRRQNCEVLLASIEAGKLDYYQLRWRGPVRMFHYVLAVKELRDLFTKFKPDVVDAHYASGYGYMAATALKNSTIPLVVQLWGSDILVVSNKSYFHKRKVVVAFGEADAVIADSQFLINEAKKIAPLNKTLVESFGIEKHFLEFHKQDYTISKPLKIIVPRPHERVYNNPFIINALAPLLKRGEVTLTFPDFGSLAVKLKREIKIGGYRGIGLYEKKNRVSFLKLMSEQDVYLSAALSDSSPVSLIEAMALGLIPVVAGIPGIKEWAGDSGAIMFDINDPNSLADKINEIITDKNKRTQMRQSNLEKVKAKGLFENNVAARIRLMNQLIANL